MNAPHAIGVLYSVAFLLECGGRFIFHCLQRLLEISAVEQKPSAQQNNVRHLLRPRFPKGAPVVARRGVAFLQAQFHVLPVAFFIAVNKAVPGQFLIGVFDEIAAFVLL